MGLLGGDYDSDEDSDEAGPQPPSAKADTPSGAGAAAAAAVKKRKVDYSKLPMSRPLALDASDSVEEAPLKKAAQHASNSFGSSLLSALPAPKVTLGRDPATSGSNRIDLSEVIRPARAKPREPVENLLRKDDFDDLNEEQGSSVPANMLNHPMFSSATAIPDGPSADDLEHMRKPMQFVNVKADDMKDPDWYRKNQVEGDPGLHAGKEVKDEVSMYDSKGWRQTGHSNPNRTQKRKHQINWLATEAMEKEAEMLTRGSAKLLTKAQTSAKYGW